MTERNTGSRGWAASSVRELLSRRAGPHLLLGHRRAYITSVCKAPAITLAAQPLQPCP